MDLEETRERMKAMRDALKMALKKVDSDITALEDLIENHLSLTVEKRPTANHLMQNIEKEIKKVV
jgi:hypothetical protein